MDSSQIELKGSQIESLRWDEGVLRIRFGRAHVLKSMTGSRERTRWWQRGTLVMEGVETSPELPEGCYICSGGDLDANVYTYRDMIPIPFESRGHVRCALKLEGADKTVVAEGTAARLELEDVPKYIEHLRP